MENSHNLQNGESLSQSNGSARVNEASATKKIDDQKQAQRLIRGMKIALDDRVTKINSGKAGYEVTGDSGARYIVSEDFQSCTCPDSERPCKHIWAARIFERLDRKAAEIRCDIEAHYESELRKFEDKLKGIAEQNFKLRLQLEAFEALKEGFKKLIQNL